MARTYRKNEKYATHPGDGTRKVYQRTVNKRNRAQAKQAIRTRGVMPVMRREVDRLQH